MQFLFRAFFIGSVFLLFYALPGDGQTRTLPVGEEIQGLTEDAYLDEIPRVLSGSRLRQATGDSPVSVTVIDREMIEASGAREIQELLRLVPGSVVSYNFGHWPAVNLGFGTESYSRRVEVLIDGRSVYTPSFGGVPWPSLPYAVSDIERIEVTRGPNSHAFGTNALLGTINIITRDPLDESGSEVEILAGDDYAHRALVRHFGSSRNADWRVSAAQWGDSGFDNSLGEFDGKSHRFINAHARYQTGPSSAVDVRGGYNRGRHEWGGTRMRDDPPRDQYWSNRFTQFNWEFENAAGNLMELRLDHSIEDIEESHFTRPQPELGFISTFVDESRRSSRSEIEFQHTLNHSERTRFLWGLGAREDEVRSPNAYFREGPGHNRFLRAFGQLEWRPTERFTFNLGGMLEEDDITDAGFSPRAGLNFHLDQRHTFRIAASQASRTPVLIEEAGHWAIDMPVDQYHIVRASGGLEREVARSMEIGHLYQSDSGRVRVDTRVHHDRIDDMIMYVTVPMPEDPYDGEVIDFFNTDQARVTGLETEVEVRPTPRTRLRANYSYKDISSTDVASEISRTAPRHNISLLGLYRLSEQTDISGQYFYYDGYNIMNLADGVDSTSRIDLRVAHRLTTQSNSPRLSLVVQSIEGSYQDSRPRNVADRRIFGEISIPL